MADAIDSSLDLYIRCYSEGDLRGIADLCLTPFFAVRRGQVEVMPDRGALVTHFTAAIDAYRRASKVRTWSALEVSTTQLGPYSALTTVHWNALDAEEQVVRDTWTSYQFITTPDGWRILSYTNHF